MRKKTLLLDFDGVLHYYNGTFSAHLGPPVDGARHACFILSREYRLVCFTSRYDTDSVERWLRANGFPEMKVTDRKQSGTIVDDRCVCFTGQWTDVFLNQVRAFRPHWAEEEANPPCDESR